MRPWFKRIFDAQTSACENFEHTLNTQKLDLSDITIHKYSTRMIMYMLKEPLRDKLDEQYKEP